MLAELRHQAGREGEARALLDDASRLATGLASAASRSAVRLSAARMSDRSRHSMTVLRHLAGLTAAELEASGDRAWEIEYLRMKAQRRIGKMTEALASGRRSLQAVGRIRGAYGSGVLRTAYLSDRSAVYGAVVELLLAAGQTTEALQVADEARGRVLVEHVATVREGDQPTVRELAEEERKLLAQVDTLAERLAAVREARASGQGDSELRHEQERTLALLEQTRTAYDELLVRTQRPVAGVQTERLDVQRLRGSLMPDEALVEFLVDDSALFTFVVTRDTVIAAREPVSRDDLGTRARIARDLAGRHDAPPRAVQSVFSELGRQLLGSRVIQEAIAGRSRLIVVPHAELTYVPFAAVIDPQTERYLVDRVSILQLPSAALLPMIRSRKTTDGARSIQALAPFPGTLPFAAEEARSVRPDGMRAEVLLGHRATERAMRDALLSGAIVHAATHGILNAANPLFSRVELARGASRGSGSPTADDGRLEVHEVLALSTSSPLVFLSGCETGAGVAGTTAFARGEDYSTLAQAFLRAGAANVIATLWRVRDDAAAGFAGQFYRALGRDGDMAGALASAQRAMRSDSRFSAPYFWAGYTLSGSGSGAGAGSAGASVP